MLTSQPLTQEEHDRLTVARNRYRRIAGVLIGAILGLIYGLISQYINFIAFPGIPFYQPPFGPVINTVLCFLGGTLLGLVSAWPSESLTGILSASAASTLLVGGYVLATARLTSTTGSATVVAVIFLLVPICGFIVPIVWSLRWAVNKQEDSFLLGYSIWSRVLAPLILAIIVGGLACTRLYPSEALPVLVRMNAMMQAGLAVSDVTALPKPLQSEAVNGFLDQAAGAFALEWTRNIERYGIPFSASNRREQSVAVAHFENGWMIACLFATPEAEPECAQFEER